MKLIFVLRPYKPTEALYGIPPSCWRKSKNCCSLHSVITHVFTHILHRKHMILPNVRTLIRPQSSQKDMACWLLTSPGQENAACTDVDRHGTHEEQLRSPVSLSSHSNRGSSSVLLYLAALLNSCLFNTGHGELGARTQKSDRWGNASVFTVRLRCAAGYMWAKSTHGSKAPGREINKRPHQSPTTLFCFTFTSCPCSRLPFLSPALHISLSSPERMEIQYVCRDQWRS